MYVRISVNKVDLQQCCASNMTICAVTVPEPRVKSLFTVNDNVDKKVKVKGKGNLFYVKNTGSGCPSLPSQGLMIEVFDIHVKRKKKKKKKKRFKNYILKKYNIIIPLNILKICVKNTILKNDEKLPVKTLHSAICCQKKISRGSIS